MVDLFSLAEAKQLGYIGGKDKKSLPVHIPEYSIEVLKFQNAAKAFETATKKFKQCETAYAAVKQKEEDEELGIEEVNVDNFLAI